MHTSLPRSNRVTNAKDVKRYLNTTTLAKDGLLIVRRHTPLVSSSECIVVPRNVLRLVVSRYFYALDLEAAIQHTSKGCHQCAALAKSPSFAVEQSSCDPPEAVGSSFAADVLKRAHQLILVVRECVTFRSCRVRFSGCHSPSFVCGCCSVKQPYQITWHVSPGDAVTT